MIGPGPSFLFFILYFEYIEKKKKSHGKTFFFFLLPQF